MKTLTILLMLIASVVTLNAEIITHSHCPNHHRNNSDNMHTHDTSDPDHNAKHVSGHPHTWEFDEFCPKGTERDTSKKSGRIGSDPADPAKEDQEKEVDEDKESGIRASIPLQTCGNTQGVYVIQTNSKGQLRILGIPRTARLHLYFDKADTTYYALLSGWVSYGRFKQFEFNKWLDMESLQVLDYRQPLAKCYSCKNLLVADAIKMELRVSGCLVAIYSVSAPAAPSLRKPKLTTMWARLKAKQ